MSNIEEKPLEFEPFEKKTNIFSKLGKMTKTLLLIALALILIIYIPQFHLDEIKLNGNIYIEVDDLLRITNIKRGDHIFTIDTDDMENRLKKDLRIEDAKVKRLFPNGLFITLKERIPIATISCEYGYLDLDAGCLVLDAYQKEKKSKRTVDIKGKTAQGLYIGDKVNDDMLQNVLIFLQAIESTERKKISKIIINSDSDIRAYTYNNIEIRLGAPERMAEKATQVEGFLIEFSQPHKPVEYVDFCYKSPFIKFK